MYQNIKRLNHLSNFIQDGGKRISDKNKNIEPIQEKISVITVVKNSTLESKKRLTVF